MSERLFGFDCGLFAAAMPVALENVPGRAQMQDWRTFPFFLTQELWTHLEETPGLPQMNRMERLSRFLVNVLGMRNPSEQTMAVMCALICRTEMDPSRLSASLQTLKTVLRTHLCRAVQQGLAVPGGVHVELLPSSFAELPDVVRQHLAGVAFVAPPDTVNVAEVLQHARGIPLRNTHRSATLQRQMQQPLLFGGAAGAMSNQLVEAAALVASAALRMPVAENHGGLSNLQLFPGNRLVSSNGSQNRQLQNLLQRHDVEAASVASAAVPAPAQAPLAIMDVRPEATQQGNAAGVDGQPSASRAEIASPLVTADITQSSDELQRAAKEDKVDLVAPRVDALREQESVQQAPKQVAAAVAQLAKAHYGEDLDLEPRPPKPRGRPPNALKRPASAEGIPKTMKKPAAAVSSSSLSTEDPSRQVGCMKKPSAKKRPQTTTSVKNTVTKAQRMRQRPHGCTTCRNTAGCCPSCWKKRGYEVLS